MQLEMTIRELLAFFERDLHGFATEHLDKPVRICVDSRKLIPGDVFWALAGENFDSHHFVDDVLKQGAIMAVVNQATRVESAQGLLPVVNTHQALLKLAKHYSRRFGFPKVAITGSNGKTTTKDMTHAALSATMQGIATQGNYNNQFGVPYTLFRLNSNLDYAVIEMGTNEPGEIKLLSQVTGPDIAVITNIGASHLEKLKDLDGVFVEKMGITAGLKNGGILILNADDPYLSKVKSRKAYKVTTFGVNRGVIKPTGLQWDESMCASFYIGRTQIKLKVPGIHNVYNALAAFAVGVSLKVSRKSLAEAINCFQGSSLRSECKEIGGIRILADCYNANPNSMKMALNAFAGMQVSGQRIAVLGDMLELGDHSYDMHHEVGKWVVENNCDVLLTLGEMGKWIAQGAIAHGMSEERIMSVEDKALALDLLRTKVQAGDGVLFKASHGMRLDLLLQQFEEVFLGGDYEH
jgi:UDP-N-acetylmuramoyl-tripeptide--D-alanyl-D-alanine ligase